MSLLTGGLGEGGGLIALGGGIEIELEEDQQLLTQDILSTRPSITTVRGSSKSSQKSERKNYKIEWDTKQKLVPDNYKIVAQLLEINGKIMEIPISGKSILYFKSLALILIFLARVTKSTTYVPLMCTPIILPLISNN